MPPKLLLIQGGKASQDNVSPPPTLSPFLDPEFYIKVNEGFWIACLVLALMPGYISAGFTQPAAKDHHAP